MRVLITGSSGYLASTIIPLLESEGHEVVPLDIKDGLDVRKYVLVKYMMRGCDAVIHLAAVVGITPCRKRLRRAIRTNVFGTRTVVLAAKLVGIPVIFASTFAARIPRSVYGMTKRLGERMVLDEGGTVLRMANIYGGKGYLKKDSVVAAFERRYRKGEYVTIHGDGSQMRDFIHVDDIARAFLTSLNAKPGLYEVYTGTETSILQLAKLMNVEYKFAPLTKPEPTQVLKGWKPAVSLEKGLKRLREAGET